MPPLKRNNLPFLTTAVINTKRKNAYTKYYLHLLLTFCWAQRQMKAQRNQLLLTQLVAVSQQTAVLVLQSRGRLLRKIRRVARLAGRTLNISLTAQWKFRQNSRPCGLPAITAINKIFKISFFRRESTITRKKTKIELQK